jgi:hypothetical protein
MGADEPLRLAALLLRNDHDAGDARGGVGNRARGAGRRPRIAGAQPAQSGARLCKASVMRREPTYFGHGTTVATNALIQHRLAVPSGRVSCRR